MEEPVFRGYSVELGVWVYGYGWFEIDYTDEYKTTNGIGGRACLLTNNGPEECYLDSVGQYIGLSDSVNNFIYEGDMVQFEVNDILAIIDGIQTVRFIDGAFRMAPAHPVSDYKDNGWIEVVGTEFERYNL